MSFAHKPTITLGDLDILAIRFVVREGGRMALERHDLEVAAHLMKRKGLTAQEASERLGMTAEAMDKVFNRPCPVDIELVLEKHPSVMGAKVIPVPVFPRTLTRTK